MVKSLESDLEMSQHSALASLTAQYTDSEEEAELEDESQAQASHVQILGTEYNLNVNFLIDVS